MNQAALRKSLHVIACNKREAFVQGSEATRQSALPFKERMDCFAALAMTSREMRKNMKRGDFVAREP